MKLKEILIIFILKIFRNLFWHFRFKIRFGLAKGYRRRIGIGFIPRFKLTKEEIFLKSLNLKNKIVFDIGGYVGIHSIFFSHTVGNEGKVITFEPNPINYGEILFNLKLNNLKNITVFPIGIGKEDSKQKLISDPIYYSRSTFDYDERKYKQTNPKNHFTVKIKSLDKLIQEKGLPKPDFIKIDVEGFEKNVIQGMKNLIQNSTPELFIEVHKRIENELITPLIKTNYLFYHIELGRKLTPEEASDINHGHLFCYKFKKSIN